MKTEVVETTWGQVIVRGLDALEAERSKWNYHHKPSDIQYRYIVRQCCTPVGFTMPTGKGLPAYEFVEFVKLANKALDLTEFDKPDGASKN